MEDPLEPHARARPAQNNKMMMMIYKIILFHFL